MEPLQLKQMQEVDLTVSHANSVEDDLRGYFTPEEWSAPADDKVTWNDARHVLSGIIGSLSDAVIAQRQER